MNLGTKIFEHIMRIPYPRSSDGEVCKSWRELKAVCRSTFNEDWRLLQGVCSTWHLHWLRLLGSCCHRHIHVRQIILALTHVLEGSKRELGSHPQPPGWSDMSHNLNLAQPTVFRVVLRPGLLLGSEQVL